MPIHLPPISRREMLSRSVSASAGLAALSLAPGGLLADEPAVNRDTAKRDTANWLLWSDPHIDKDPERDKNDSGYYMYANLVKATQEALARKKNAAGIFINGDCANLYGLQKDYEVLAELLEPLSKAGFPLHITMGNHDNRSTFAKVLAKYRPDNPGIHGRRIGVVEARHANWFLLDSLRVVNAAPGELGKDQLAWLQEELDKKPEKPAIIMVHHNPKLGPNERVDGLGRVDPYGLTDTDALFAAISPRRHVKAVMFGHLHHWCVYKHDDIHLVALPALGRHFNKVDPLGWVDANLLPDGIKLELRALDPKHKAHGEVHELKRRT